jgi:hypothetical protein
MTESPGAAPTMTDRREEWSPLRGDFAMPGQSVAGQICPFGKRTASFPRDSGGGRAEGSSQVSADPPQFPPCLVRRWWWTRGEPRRPESGHPGSHRGARLAGRDFCGAHVGKGRLPDAPERDGKRRSAANPSPIPALPSAEVWFCGGG